jgi:hypothetical protein
MKKFINGDLIVESTPIFGIYNKVIDSNLEVITKAEFYCVNLEAFQSFNLKDGLTFMQIFFSTISANARRMSNLTASSEGGDQEVWDDEYTEFYDSLEQNGLTSGCVKKIVISKGERIILGFE